MPLSHFNGVSRRMVLFMSSRSSRRMDSEGSWMRFCISLPMSREGVGPACYLSWHDTISGEETHDGSPSRGPLLVNKLAQSSSFRYCSMVSLVVLVWCEVDGILDVCVWDPDPDMYMIWGTSVVNRLEIGLLFCVPLSVMPFLPTIVIPIVLLRCPTRFVVGPGVCPTWPGFPPWPRFNVEEVVACCESVSDIDHRFVPWTGLHVSGHFRLGSAESFLHDSVKVVFHDSVWQVTSSICMNLSTWTCRVWAMTTRVVGYPMSPISFGVVHGWFVVLSFKRKLSYIPTSTVGPTFRDPVVSTVLSTGIWSCLLISLWRPIPSASSPVGDLDCLFSFERPVEHRVHGGLHPRGSDWDSSWVEVSWMETSPLNLTVYIPLSKFVYSS